MTFVPLFSLGFVLAYARWRTASLWMPIGLNAGWLFTLKGLENLFQSKTTIHPNHLVDIPMILQQGLIPLSAIVLTGILVHYLTQNPDETRTSDS